MNKDLLRIDILAALHDGPRSVEEILAYVWPGRYTFSEDVKVRAEVLAMIDTLRLEHLIWPKDGRYFITSRGRKTHGKVC